MADKSKIEWTDATWNPVTGCTKVSPGCDHCYAERITDRFKRHPFTTVTLHPDRLNQPRHWKTPRRIFVCSMGDLFHSDVPFDFIGQVFAVMINNPRHIFQVLTKRPGRIAYYARQELKVPWPPNVWAGTSVEQEWDGNRHLTARLDLLARVPANVRFVSYEPALGPVDFEPWFVCNYCGKPEDSYAHNIDGHTFGGCVIDWVIAGGESGPGARPAHPDWFRQVRDQCQAAGVPFFFKQWGEWYPIVTQGPVGEWKSVTQKDAVARIQLWDDDDLSIRIGKKAAGALLDGREWREFPG